MILSWKVSTKLSAQLRTETFRTACDTALIFHPKQTKEIRLVVDGGSENNNGTVDNFIESATLPVKKIRALKDVLFSNSQIEALNKIIKTRYLNNLQINGTAQLITEMERIVHDLNHERPHGSIGGMIPFDYYTGKRPD